MSKGVYDRLRVILSLLLGLIGLWLVLGDVSVAPAVADSGAAGGTLDRDVEPVVVSGLTIGAVAGFPIDQMFVYAYTNGGWSQIPSQFDEVTASGAYTTTEDGLLDVNDELVLMARDLGDRAPAGASPGDDLPIGPGWYELEITDPTNPSRQAWAYLVHSSALNRTFISDYVDFNPSLHEIDAASYKIRLGVTHPGFDYFSLNSSEVDILDRTKLYWCRGENCNNEEDVGARPDDLIKDGPVRVIARGGRAFAYGSTLSWTTSFRFPVFLRPDFIRFSADFEDVVSGATHYSGVVPDGVVVDGMPDVVQEQPLSSWWQLSTDFGTVIQTSDTSALGGSQVNYYVDDATMDESDTGDKKHYGDAGIVVENPSRDISYAFTFYILPDRQPNVGARYEAYFGQSLFATATIHGDPRPEKVYLPVILGNTVRP